MGIPLFPEWAPITIDMRSELHPGMSLLPDGVSEFTFAGLYLFRRTYNYHVSYLPGDKLAISGHKEGKRFFMVPCGLPDDRALWPALFEHHDYLKGMPESYADSQRVDLERAGYVIEEDRDNFDYLYLRKDLAQLAGKQYHKKRNHVNAFVNTYNFDESPLTGRNIDGAVSVLEHWHKSREEDVDDFEAAREALELWHVLDLKGYLVRVDGTPAAYTLGESIAKGRTFVVHFEKAVDGYRGIYQYINKAFASTLPRHFTNINREQDLGNEGLRQAKMTYRPSGFVKKYRVYRENG